MKHKLTMKSTIRAARIHQMSILYSFVIVKNVIRACPKTLACAIRESVRHNTHYAVVYEQRRVCAQWIKIIAFYHMNKIYIQEL